MLEMDFLWRENWKNITKMQIMLLCMLKIDFFGREHWKTCDKNRISATMHARNELFEVDKGFQNIAHQIAIAQYSILR